MQIKERLDDIFHVQKICATFQEVYSKSIFLNQLSLINFGWAWLVPSKQKSRHMNFFRHDHLTFSHITC